MKWPEIPVWNITPDRSTREDGLSPRLGLGIASVISSFSLQVRWYYYIRWPSGISPVVGTLSARALSSENWAEIAAPIVFAAEIYSGEELLKGAISRLALVFHPIMKILLEYYLSPRVADDHPMLKWMFLFGVIYDESAGYELVAFIPTWHYNRILSTGQPCGWGASARLCNSGFASKMMQESAGCRVQRLEKLYFAQAHNLKVSNHLQKWPGKLYVKHELLRSIALG
ncbi:hypothetical protein PIIN_05064 [Serendipita indica DSM 11827]|uniref:Uncharacterized protein n=1 Tax=Serendipita indica (strain DSM 11827) TaxID=1109443 RepID=G4TII6_SERID|nr:hypothetical protein PIIN_05064 [Serendipita indica DSM 11827]